jgi:hypothetical protein
LFERYGALYAKIASEVRHTLEQGLTKRSDRRGRENRVGAVGETLLERYAALYEEIASELQHALEPGWTKTWAWSEMSERDGSVVVYYLDGAQTIRWITPPLTLYERFRQLNNAARNADPNAVWTSVTFTLDANGAFEVDFGYDPIPIENEAERRTAWKARYLPY